MTDASVRNHRLSFLDCIRGIAALAVLIEHVAERATPHFHPFVHDSFSFGKFGVTAFFLTSGFVIPFTLERTNSLKKFWTSRFFRLYPLYWLSLGIVLGSYLLGMSNAVSNGFPSHFIRNALVNFTMFQEFVGVPNAEALYYTLGMEMAFYIFASFLFLRGLHHMSLRIAWIAAGTLACASILVPLLLHKRVPMAGLFYFLCFLVGTVIYRRFTGHISAKSLSMLLGFVWLTTMVEIYLNYVFIKKDDATEHFTFWAVLLPWFLAYAQFLLAYQARARRFPQAFVWLGTISYSVYLLHPTIARLIPEGPHGVLSFFAVLSVTVLVSGFTYRFVEQPFVRMGRDIQRRFDGQHLAQSGAHREGDASGSIAVNPLHEIENA